MSVLRLRAPVALALACCLGSAHAQLAIQNGSSVTEDFSTLASTGTTGSTLPPGWLFSEAGGSAPTTYGVDTGANNAGNTYSYGAAASTERAFASLLSGTVTPTLGVQLQNTGATAITSLDVAYTGEQWRLGTADRAIPDRLDFQYSTDATSLTTGTWTSVDALDFVGPVVTGALGARDGNVAPNRTAIAGSITGINIAANASLWIRWTDFNASGADDGLAIDDVRFGQAVDIAPTVASTSPAQAATGVVLNSAIVVTFSEAVTTTGSWFAFDCGAGTPTLTASGGPAAYTLSHATPLPASATCTLTIENTLVADQDGTAETLAADYVLSFQTAVDNPPAVVATTPANGASNVARGADLTVTFNEPVDAAAGAFALECPDNTTRAISASTDDGILHTVHPTATLPASTACVFTVDAAFITDRDGVANSPLEGVTVSFTTAPVAPPVILSTVPTDGATNFPAAGELVVSFDQSVTAAANAFSLTCDTSTGIVLTYAPSGTTFELDTGTALVDGESCTLHIEADNLVSADGLHPAADVDVVFAVSAAGPGTYYATVNTSSPGQLRCTLHDVIDGHTKYPYSAGTTDTWDILEIADQDPANSGRVVDIYRNESYIKHGAGNDDYNREHTWPNSLGFPDQQQLAAYTDTHMLYISNDTYNSTRGNTPYGNCTSGCTSLATLATNGRGGTPAESNLYNGDNIFQVWSGRKGDAARAILYMAIRYEGGDGTPDLELTNNLALVVGTSQNAPKAYMGKLDDLIAWHQADPPDAQEMLRNEAVSSFQGNRNPFIDHPEWGTLALFQSTTPPVCQPLGGGGNTAPVANDDTYAPTEDTAFVRAAPGVLGNDTDAQGQPLTATLMANVTHGALTFAANGSFTYTPAANYCGPDGFSYQANDGALNSATALVTLNVACVNDAPVANDPAFSIAENSAAGTSVGSVIGTDVDAGQTLAYAITGGNAAGAFAINATTGAITVANAGPLNFETTTSFTLTVTVSDNGAPVLSDSSTVTITVTNVDEGAAAANDDVFTVLEDSGASVLTVLANDTADPDGGALQVTAVTQPANGVATFTAGNASYTPNADYCGADSFTYTVTGGDTATVTLTVTCVDDPVLPAAIFRNGFEN